MTLTPRHKQLLIAAVCIAQQNKHDFFLEMRELNNYTQDESEDWLFDELAELVELITDQE